MRGAAALLAVLLAILPILALALRFDFAIAWVTAIVSLLLLTVAIVALRGGDLIYLASAWSLYIGMSLSFYVGRLEQLAGQSAPDARFGAILISIPLVVSLLGLAFTVQAYRTEKRT